MNLGPALRAHLPRLRSRRGIVVVTGALLAAVAAGAVLGQAGTGLLVAAALLPLAVAPAGDAVSARRPGLDAVSALAAGLLLTVLCQWAWSPWLITGGATTGSDLGEHLWMLHSLQNPGWEHFSLNRYPLPAVFAALVAWGGTPHAAWYSAAVLSMVGTGAGLWLWGRAVGNPAAGWAAILMVGALPDLVVMTRTVSVYPELVAIWTLAAGLAATALRWPSPISLLLAGGGCAAAFAADARGLAPGLLAGTVAMVAALTQPGGWRRRGLGLALLSAPVAASWLIYRFLPLHPWPLERLLATSVQVSFTRLGESSSWGQDIHTGWVWGRSLPWDLPHTLLTLRLAQAALNPAAALGAEQQADFAQSVRPLLGPAAALGALALAWCLAPRASTAPARVHLPRLRWRASLALLPLAAHLTMGLTSARYEYNSRYFGLAMPGLALLLGLGMAVGARRRPPWLALLPAIAALYLLPSDLHLGRPWRQRGASPPELQRCLAASDPALPAPERGAAGVSDALFECIQAQRLPLRWGIRSPW
jgi:hypothetical protein